MLMSPGLPSIWRRRVARNKVKMVARLATDASL